MLFPSRSAHTTYSGSNVDASVKESLCIVVPVARHDRHRVGAIRIARPGPQRAPTPPKATFVLKDRQGRATPSRTKYAHTGGGNTDVIQPRDREDTLIISMTGVVTAGPHPFEANAADIDFDLDQNFAIAFADPKLTKARLTLEARSWACCAATRTAAPPTSATG